MNPIASTEDRLRYIERRKKDLVTLQTAVTERSVDAMREIAHQIKGNGITFGFPELSSFALRLENALHDADFEAAAQEVEWLDQWIKNSPSLN